MFLPLPEKYDDMNPRGRWTMLSELRVCNESVNMWLVCRDDECRLFQNPPWYVHTEPNGGFEHKHDYYALA